MEDFSPVSPHEGKSPEAHAKKLGKQIIGSIPGDIDRSGEIGATAAANILIDIVRNDRLVVTPDDVQTTAEEYTLNRELSYPEISREIKSWLPYLDLIEVDTSYSNEWQTWETIWVAPIFPRLEDILEYADNPPVLSMPTIEHVIETTFSVEEQNSNGKFKASDVDTDELDAFLSYIRLQLDEDWVPIGDTNKIVWVNPAHVDEILSDERDVYSFEEVTTKISEILNQSTHLDESLIPAEVGSKNISPVMDRLEKRFEWNRLATSTAISWYNDSDQFSQDYREHAEAAQEIVDNRREASIEELQQALTFFDHNRRTLIKQEDTSRGQLDYVVRLLESSIDMLEERMKIESSEVGDEMTTTMETKDLTEYHTAIKFEEKLENMKEEEVEEEGIDKGHSDYRF